MSTPEEIAREWLLDLKPLCRSLVIEDDMEATNENLLQRIRYEVNTRTITCQDAPLLDLPENVARPVREWVRQKADLNLCMPVRYTIRY
jgi:hypothetical protein